MYINQMLGNEPAMHEAMSRPKPINGSKFIVILWNYIPTCIQYMLHKSLASYWLNVDVHYYQLLHLRIFYSQYLLELCFWFFWCMSTFNHTKLSGTIGWRCTFSCILLWCYYFDQQQYVSIMCTHSSRWTSLVSTCFCTFKICSY